MRRLRVPKKEEYDPFAEDVERICRVAADYGYHMEPEDAREAWLAYSGSCAAGWLFLPEDDDGIMRRILGVCEEY